METQIESKLNHYKSIEQLCEKNYLMWENCPNFRGAFSKFAMRVSQLDLLAAGDVFIQKLTNYSADQLSFLIREIDTLLKEHFDRYFAYLRQRNMPIYATYSAMRQQAFT